MGRLDFNQNGRRYHFQFLHVGCVVKVFVQVEMFHEVEHQGERVLEGTIYPYEGHDVPMRKEVVCVCFPLEPLGAVLFHPYRPYQCLSKLTIRTRSQSKRT